MSQHQVGSMYCEGRARGVDVDYAQARAWFEKAAAQDEPLATEALGTMYSFGEGVTPSFRRAREYYERALELGDSVAVKSMQSFTKGVQMVTSRRSNPFSPPSVLPDPAVPHTHKSLRSHAQLAPLMDKRVEIHGTARADMNGKCGVATDFHPMGGRQDRTKDRYTVKLDGGEAFKVKPANVRAEGTGGGDGDGGGGGSGGGSGGGAGAGKAKGKKGGKKGRGGRK